MQPATCGSRAATAALRGAVRGSATAVIAAAVLLLAGIGAQTATAAEPKPKKPPSVRVVKPATDRGSGESSAERDRRLLRECKGRPNAGACAGYVR